MSSFKVRALYNLVDRAGVDIGIPSRILFTLACARKGRFSALSIIGLVPHIRHRKYGVLRRPIGGCEHPTAATSSVGASPLADNIVQRALTIEERARSTASAFTRRVYRGAQRKAAHMQP